MKLQEHIDQVNAGNHTPRVVERSTSAGVVFVAWFPCWEGPARPDYAAAAADVRDHAEKRGDFWEINTPFGRQSVRAVR